MTHQVPADHEHSELFKFEMKIARLLRWGVILSGVLLFSGWILRIQWNTNPFERFHDYGRVSLLEELHRGAGASLYLCYAGLGLLVSLPLLRVGLTAFLFWRRRDRILAIIACFVFITLVASCFLGLEI